MLVMFYLFVISHRNSTCNSFFQNVISIFFHKTILLPKRRPIFKAVYTPAFFLSYPARVKHSFECFDGITPHRTSQKISATLCLVESEQEGLDFQE